MYDYKCYLKFKNAIRVTENIHVQTSDHTHACTSGSSFKVTALTEH